MTTVCEDFIRSVINGLWKNAFSKLSRLGNNELFRALAVLDSLDLDGLLAHRNEAVNGDSTMQAKLPQMDYAIAVVKHRKKPPHGTVDHRVLQQLDHSATGYLHECVIKKNVPLKFERDLTGTLPAPNPNPPALSEQDYQQAAKEVGADVESIKAVARVESSGSGFGADGRPVIRYELHIFQRFTRRIYHKTHPYLSQTTLSAGERYHTGSQEREYTLLFNAMILRRKDGRRRATEAIESASWGKFQVMGFNYSTIGWKSAESFAGDMYRTEGQQLKAFVGFIRHAGLGPALARHNWAAFAAGYNGADYRAMNYDVRIERAYEAIRAAENPAHAAAHGAQ